ncbi:MAG: methyltransferase domain-containing protein [Burkholderiales bacterium]|nr:methyltransferase domain-containing protein [Burkholderiales bacterium]
MSHSGPQFYDDATVFAAYAQLRERADSPNDTLDRPTMRALLGDVTGKRILDLGCGDAAFGRDLLAAGAGAYHGVDGSANMVAGARRNLAGTVGTVDHCGLDQWSYPEAGFDRVVSRLALHYLPDLESLFRKAWRTLVPGGQLVYSVEHPVLTAFDNECDDGAQLSQWVVDNYFVTGERVTTWLGSRVVKYHRTVEDHVGALQAAGFDLHGLRESRPERRHFVEAAEFERRQRFPLFLFIAAEKP